MTRTDLVQVPLNKIRLDTATQSRAMLDAGYCRELAEILSDLPPPVVFFDGQVYWIGDGWHRVTGHKIQSARYVVCEVREGTRRDAILYAVGANAPHDRNGLRRTNADKRRAVELLLADEGWAAESNAWIAEKCGVSDRFVSRVRKELSPNRSGMVKVHRGESEYDMDTAGMAGVGAMTAEDQLRLLQEDDLAVEQEEPAKRQDDDGLRPLPAFRRPILIVQLYGRLGAKAQAAIGKAFDALVVKAGKKAG